MKKLKRNKKLRNLFFASAAATGISFFGGFLMGKYSNNEKIEPTEKQDTVLIALPNPNQTQIDSLESSAFSSFYALYKASPLPSSKTFFKKSENSLKFYKLNDIIKAKKQAEDNIIKAQSSQDIKEILKTCAEYQQVLSSGFALIKQRYPEIVNSTNLNSLQLNARIYSAKSFIQTGIKAGIFDIQRIDKEESLYTGQVLIRDYNIHRRQYNDFYKAAKQKYSTDSLAFEKQKQEKIDSLQNTPITYEEFYTKHKRIVKQSSR